MSALGAFEPWRDAHRRTAWRPVIGSGAGRSHFGGAPWLAPGEPWPSCAVCGRPQQLLVQLDLATLPPELTAGHGSGLLQVFYCTRSDGDCEQEADGWAAFSACHLVRVVPGSEAGGEPPPLPDSFSRGTIVDWRPEPDLPDPESHERLGIEYDYDHRARTVMISWPAAGVTVAGSYEGEVAAELLASAIDGDKVGGWPRWVQREELPSCPRCGDEMAYLLQLDSEDHVPFMWGDAGIATVTRCHRHPDVVALGWACS